MHGDGGRYGRTVADATWKPPAVLLLFNHIHNHSCHVLLRSHILAKVKCRRRSLALSLRRADKICQLCLKVVHDSSLFHRPSCSIFHCYSIFVPLSSIYPMLYRPASIYLSRAFLLLVVSSCNTLFSLFHPVPRVPRTGESFPAYLHVVFSLHVLSLFFHC